ncbi:hypothetical protein [Flavobacterium xueshanense]|uniref:Uncharacterized protein n=1 Tax=Flavobacterium xueshanense TaxID=935223 RepID=A0A1I2FX65_9FLAO|nr:hypothetical protein [Flavobacterium xueshanense]SFF09543.1 hypothetical protein SAMN04488131_108158 [Flavobacterium xueshanense]
MNLTNNFRELTLTTNGILLILKTKEKKQILFSDLDLIYITVNKMKTIYEVLILLFATGLAAFNYLFFQIDLILIIAFLVVIAIIFKKNDYKSYSLKLRLQNCQIFKNKAPLKSKHDTIDMVNEVRKEIYNIKMKKSNEVIISVS